MKLQTFIKKNIKYIFLFILFFLCLQFFYVSFSVDQIYNYGFSYAITRGEIPYKDFNMIIPPVGAFVYAFPFLLFGHSLIAFNLYQAFLLCLLVYFLFKLFDKKAWILLIVLLMPIPIPFGTVLFQGYNFLLVLEFVLLMYLERNKKSDYLIGVLLGFFVLTKQTVGVLMCIPSLIYLFRDYKKSIKRFIGFLVPCFAFLIYLLCTGSFLQFWDMCLFGMFDFTNKNGTAGKFLTDFYFYFWIFEILILSYFSWRERKDRNLLMRGVYTLLFSIIAVPLFDYNHVSHFSFVFVMFFITKINIKNKNIGFNALLFSSALSIIWFLFIFDFSMPNFVYFNNYEFGIMSKKGANEIRYLTKYMKKNKNTILLSENAYLVKIVLDYDLDYYDLLNCGNHGYDGTNKLIKRLDSEKDKYILVNTESYERKSVRQQFNKEVVEHVMENYKKIDRLGVYDVYYKE